MTINCCFEHNPAYRVLLAVFCLLYSYIRRTRRTLLVMSQEDRGSQVSAPTEALCTVSVLLSVYAYYRYVPGKLLLLCCTRRATNSTRKRHTHYSPVDDARQTRRKQTVALQKWHCCVVIKQDACGFWGVGARQQTNRYVFVVGWNVGVPSGRTFDGRAVD